MCRAIGEGGLRCAAHTRPAYQRAEFGTAQWDAAAAAYASTREGRARLTEELATANSDSTLIERYIALGRAIQSGETQREVAHATWVAVRNSNTTAPRPLSATGVACTYYADENTSENAGLAFTCEPLTGVRSRARVNAWNPVPLRVRAPVRGEAVVMFNGRGAGFSVEDSPHESNRLRCACVDYQRDYRCEHVDNTLAAIQSRINQDLISEGHVTLALAEREHFGEGSPTIDVGPELVNDGVSYIDSPDAFQDDYKAARERRDAGENPVEYMTENATNGLAAPGARSFGIELEFSAPDAASVEAIARELHEANLTPSARQAGYHSDRTTYSRHEGGWKFEEDCTVHQPHNGIFGGEIVSPKMNDTPETWENLQKVCDIVERNGGRASVRAGSHIHVSSGDFNADGSDHGRLLNTFSDNEDLMFRLASNPERGTHRRLDSDSDWSRPNDVAGAQFTSLRSALDRAHHSSAINLENCSGRSGDHVEFRMWDSTMKPANIQAQVKLSLALTEAAHRDTEYTPSGNTPIGSRRKHNRETFGENRALRGDDWTNDTESFRALADKLFVRADDKKQMTALFAATKWQFRSRRRRADRDATR